VIQARKGKSKLTFIKTFKGPLPRSTQDVFERMRWQRLHGENDQPNEERPMFVTALTPKNRWMETQTKKQTDGWMDRWMGGWVDASFENPDKLQGANPLRQRCRAEVLVFSRWAFEMTLHGLHATDPTKVTGFAGSGSKQGGSPCSSGHPSSPCGFCQFVQRQRRLRGVPCSKDDNDEITAR
jgi:hypothetical protein